MTTTGYRVAAHKALPADLQDDTVALTDNEGRPLLVPLNVAFRIFYYLRRDDLDTCLLVCHQWKWLVNKYNAHLPWRAIDCVVLSTAKEFTIKVAYKNRLKTHVFKKYFRDRDIDAYEMPKEDRLLAPFDVNSYSFRCHAPLILSVGEDTQYPHGGRFHHSTCKSNRAAIHRSHVAYGSKLFTPPLAYYERLEWLLRNAYVKTLILRQFTMTDLFVEKFAEFLGRPLEVDNLHLHDVKLRYIGIGRFHDFLAEAVLTRNYVLDNLRYALPDHINGELLQKPAIRKAKMFYVGRATSRFDTTLRFNVEDDDFFSYVTSTSDGDEADFAGREFFGIADSRVSDTVAEQYRKLHILSAKKELLFPHVLFGEQRFIAANYTPPQDTIRQPRQRHAASVHEFHVVRSHGGPGSSQDDGETKVLDLFPTQ